MIPELYLVSGSPRCWRVLLGLTFKGLDWNEHILEYSRQEHRSPEFLKRNPRGTVPVLEADGIILRDSIAILAWLDRQYPSTPLFGKTAREAGTIWQIVLECSEYLRAAHNGLLGPVFSGDGSVPAEGSEAMKALSAASEALHAECHILENLIGDRPFFAGETPTAADAVIFPELRLIERAIRTKFELMSALGWSYPPDIYPRLAEWKTRVGQLPGVAATLPRHWDADKTSPETVSPQ
jgi:glutathione S-transferase